MAGDWHGTPRVPLQLSRGIVIASIQSDLTTNVLERFRDELLPFIRRHGAPGVVVDFSGVDVVDATEFDALRRLLTMASLLGARPMVSGLSAGIIASLVDTGANIDDITGALHAEDAVAALRAGADAPLTAAGGARDAQADPDAG